MESIVITKSSSNDELRQYFCNLLELTKSNKDFPVDLDCVWPVVYSRRDKAYSTLKENFVEGEDYQIYQFNKPVNSYECKNGCKIVVKLSIPCMEYLIARKVRAVFEVYRAVFHKVAEIGQSCSNAVTPAQQNIQLIQALLQQAQITAEIEAKADEAKRTADLAMDRLDRLETEREENGQLLLSMNKEDGNKVPDMTTRNKCREMVNAYSKAKNISQSDVYAYVYKVLYYKYNVSVNSMKINNGESKLEALESRGHIGKIYDILCEMTRR